MRVERLEERALLSIGGVSPDELSMLTPRKWWPTCEVAPVSPVNRMKLSPLPSRELLDNDDSAGDTRQNDLDSYVPLPFPESSESTTTVGQGFAISYDLRTGQETLHGSTAESSAESGQTDGGLGAITEWLAENDVDGENLARGFTNLTRVNDPEVFPYCVNVKLFMDFNGHHYVASGVLIDSMHVLTAGHCVYSHDSGEVGWANSIRVVPAYENGAKPFGEANAAELHSWTGWTSDESYSHDIGVIDLDRPVGALTGWNGYGYNTSESFFLNNTFYNPGYPAESPYTGEYMYEWHGDFDYAIPLNNQIGIWQDGYGGQSGSGAYYTSGGSRTVYAVLSNGGSGFENFVRLNEEKFEDIRDSFIPADVPATPDLIPLTVSASDSVDSGSVLGSLSYLVHNYSSNSWSGTVNVDVYLSTDDYITTSDLLIGSHNLTRTISAKGTTTVNVSSLPTIPADVATGNYKIGIIITTPDANTSNNDTITWDVEPIYVNHVNQPPVFSVLLPNKSLDEDTSINNAIDLWDFVTDPETAGGDLIYTIVGNTAPGCGVTIDPDDFIDIAPTASWNGYSDVTIRATDPSGLYDEDTFRITVNPVNDAPVFGTLPDKSLNEDTVLNNTINLWNYVSDLETTDSGLIFTIVGNTAPSCGVTIDTNQYIDVAPTAHWNGYSDVTIRATDPSGLYDEDTFRVTVASVNDTPVLSALPDKSLSEDGTLNNAIDLYSHASDVETADSGLTYAIVGNTAPSCGVTLDSSRYLDITPTAHWNGYSDVTIRVTDPGGLYVEDTFRITVASVNDAPVIGTLPDRSLNEDTTLDNTINLWDYVSDIETADSGLTYTIVGNTNANCGATIDSSHYLDVAPTAHWNGYSDVTIRISDPGGLYVQDTFRITVAPVNDPPAVVNDVYQCDRNGRLVRSAAQGVLVNDGDIDSTSIEAVLLTAPAHGTVTLGDDGSFNYRPASNHVGADSFTYRAFDGTAYSSAATVTITVVARIPGDATGDDTVGQADATVLSSHWGMSSNATWNDGDFNNDGAVNALDASILAANWGATAESALVGQAVPDNGDNDDTAGVDSLAVRQSLIYGTPTNESAHDAALAEEYGPQVASENLRIELLEGLYTTARRTRPRTGGQMLDNLVPTVIKPLTGG